MGENIKRLLNLIEHVHQAKCPAVVYFVDCNKAFDRVGAGESIEEKSILESTWIGLTGIFCSAVFDFMASCKTSTFVFQGHL